MVLEPDPGQLADFIRVIFRNASAQGFVAVRSFYEGEDKVFRLNGTAMVGGLGFLVSVCEDDARRAAQSPKPAVFCPPLALFANKDKARERDITEGLALSVECDTHPQEARATLEALIGPATVVVKSGGRWINGGEAEDKLHLHWRLAKPAKGDDLARLKQARDLAARLVGGDPSNKPVCHPIRWPGSWHRKGEPRLCQIETLDPDREVDLNAVLAELIKAAPEAENEPRESGSLQADPKLVANAVKDIPNDFPDATSWSEWNRIGMAIYGATGGSGEGLKIFHAYSAKSDRYSEKTTNERWENYHRSPPTKIGAGTLFHLAKSNAAASGGLQDSVALNFATLHVESLRYVAIWNRWMQWEGHRWRVEDTLAAFDQARTLCRAAGNADAKVVAAVVTLARSDRRLAATAEQWDRDKWLLGTPDGVVDLKTGKLRPSSPEDYITKITTVAPSGDCPLWRKFLKRVTGGDAELEKYLQRVCGYALTGDTSEDALFFFYGTGANGKSVFLRTIAGILGDHHTTASMEMFTVTNNERHPTDLADLRGARLVTAIETEEGKRWDEAKIKALTGGDRIKARFMRQDFFEYTPQFKLMIAGNHRPAIRTIDEAIRRRMNLIPFTETIPEEERDLALTDKLRAEWPAILAWMIEGCLDWQRDGLQPPKAVKDATEEYLEAEDALKAFIDENCETGKDPRTGQDYVDSIQNLWNGWKVWAEKSGEFIGNKRKFGDKLVDKGFPRTKGAKGGRNYRGILFVAPAAYYPGAYGGEGP